MAVYAKTATLTYKSNATHETLCEALDEQRTQGEFCDVRFLVEGVAVMAHRAVLSARSPYFHTMFTSNFQETGQVDIDMSHIFSTAENFREVLKYIYRGSIEISGDTFEEVLNGASHFLMEKLRLTCAQYMVTNVGPHNCLRMWALADRYNLDNVASICKAMAKSRFHDSIIYLQETLEIPSEFLRAIIKDGIMDATPVEDKLRFLRRWLDYDLKEREPIFKDILQAILERKCNGDNRLNPLCSSITHKSYLNVLKMVDYTLSGFQLRGPSTYPTVGLVGMVKEKRPQTSRYHLTLLAYITEMRRWMILGEFEHDPSVVCKQVLGFVRHFAVFKGGDSERIVLADLKSGLCEELPEVPWGSSDRIGPLPQFFCYDETVFCVVDWGNTCTPTKTSGVRPQAENTKTSKGSPDKKRLYVNRRLFKLDIKTRSWGIVCDLPMTNGSAVHFMRYQQRQQSGKVYIWAGQRRADTGGSSEAPYWMCLTKDGTQAYKVIQLATPQTDPLNGRAVTLSGTGNKIVVSSMVSVSSQRVYDILEGTWTVQQKEKYVKPPGVETLPLEGHTFTTVEMPGPSSYLATDYLYYMDILCPCVSKFWGYNLVGSERRWVELPSPPTENVKKYVACYIPGVVMGGAKQAYYMDTALAQDQGPLTLLSLDVGNDCLSRSALPLHMLSSGEINSGSHSSSDSSPRRDDSRLSPAVFRNGTASPNVVGPALNFIWP